MINRIQKYFLIILVLLGGIVTLPSPVQAAVTGYVSVNPITGPLSDDNSELIVVNQKVTVEGSLSVNNLKFGYGQESSLKYLICASDVSDTNPKLDDETSNPIYGCGQMREIARGNFSGIKGSPAYLALKERNSDGTRLNPEGDFVLNFNASAFQTTDKYMMVAIYGVVDATLVDGTGLKTIALSSEKIAVNVIDENQAKILKNKDLTGTPDPDLPGALRDGPFQLWSEKILNSAQIRGGLGDDIPSFTVHVGYIDNKGIAHNDVTPEICNCTINSVEWRMGDPNVNGQSLNYDGNNFDNKLIIDVNAAKVVGVQSYVRVLLKITTADGTKITYTDTKSLTLLTVGGLTSTDSQGTDQGGLLGEKTLLGVLAQAFSFILYLLITILNSLMTVTVIPLIRSLLAIQAHDPAFSSAILGSWIVVRNITNIFFILAMIAMSIGTLFDLHGYNYKELLGRLVLMALLVNFSLVIARVVLGVADTLQAQFIPFGDANVMNNLLSHLAIDPIKNLSFNTPAKDDLAQFAGHLTGAVVYLVFALASFAAFMALAIFLLIRICGLLVLLVTSPIAYAGMVFGDHSPLGKLGAKWWSNFIRYAFFTPIIAFFLYLAAYVANSQSDFLNKSTLVAFPTSNLPDFSQTVFNIASNVIVIGLIFAGLKLAKGFDIQAVNTTVDKFSGAFSAGGSKIKEYSQDRAQRAKDNLTSKLTDIDKDKMGTRTAKLRRGLAATIAPQQFLANRKKNFEKKNEQAAERSKAGFERSSLYRSSHGLSDNDAVAKVKNKQDDEEAEYFLNKNKIEELDKTQKAFNAGKINKQEMLDRKTKILRAALQKGDIRKMVEAKYGKGKYTRKNLAQFLATEVGDSDEAKRLFGSVNDIGKKEKRLALVAMNKIDPKKVGDPAEFNRMNDLVDVETAKEVKDATEEDLAKWSFSGVPKFREDVAGNPIMVAGAPVPTQTYVELKERIKEGDEVKVTGEMVKMMGPSGFETSSSVPVFETAEEGKMFYKLVDSPDAGDQEAARRLLNTSVGGKKDGTNGFNDLHLLPRDFLIKAPAGSPQPYVHSSGRVPMGSLEVVTSMNPMLRKLKDATDGTNAENLFYRTP